MTRMELQIGGLRFLQSSALPICYGAMESLYAPFLAPGSGGDDADVVRIHVRPNETPPPDHQPFFFDAASWRASGDSVRRRLTQGGAGAGEPAWTAVFDLPLRDAEVYCSSHFVHRTPEGDAVMGLLAYPLDQLLTMYALASRRGAIAHAAGAVLNGRGLALLGRSGAGKSTLSRLIREAGGAVLSDDRLILRATAGGARMFGTPWPGEAKIAVNESVPLAALLFLRKAPEARLTRLSITDAVERLLLPVSIPWHERELTGEVLSFLEGMAAAVPAYDFFFPPHRAAVEVLPSLV